MKKINVDIVDPPGAFLMDDIMPEIQPRFGFARPDHFGVAADIERRMAELNEGPE